MRGKKTAQLAYRLTDEEKLVLTKIAGELRMKPAEIVSIVMAQFITARKKHGRYLIWPPEFNHFVAMSSKQDLLAAEDGGDSYMTDRPSG
jgi:hypothetical protein